MKPQSEGAAGIDHIQDLLGKATARGVDIISEVKSLEVDVEVAVDVVTGAQVQAGGGFDEHRLRAKLGVGLVLAEVIQKLGLMVDRKAQHEPILLEEGHEVVG